MDKKELDLSDLKRYPISPFLVTYLKKQIGYKLYVQKLISKNVYLEYIKEIGYGNDEG